MPPITYDTSIFKSYKPEEFPSGFGQMEDGFIGEIEQPGIGNIELPV